MTGSYKSVSWGREPTSPDKLNVMAQNDEWLKNHLPFTLLQHQGLKKDTQIKFLVGSSLVPPQNTWSQSSDIYFGNYFSAGSKPVVVHSVYGHPQTGVSSTIHGIGKQKVPDHRGFTMYLWANDRSGLNSAIRHPMVVAYIAVGY